jgi:hypothetical protein
MNRKETEKLFFEVIDGKTLRPVINGEASDWQFIRLEWVPNAHYNRDQTRIYPGHVISWRCHGTSAQSISYKEFLFLIEQIFEDVEEFELVKEGGK